MEPLHVCYKLRRRMFVLAFTGLAAVIASAAAPSDQPVVIQGAVFQPQKTEPTAERIKQLKLPSGFSIAQFTDELQAPRMMAVAPNGDVYVTQRAPQGDVHLVRDRDGDGRAETVRKVASLPNVHGVAIRGNRIYLAAIRDVYEAEIQRDGTISKPRALFTDLPDAGQHPNRTMSFDPQGRLFLSVGSMSNAADEPNEESATLLVLETDGSDRRIFARGLRNTIGFDWHPRTGELWGMDHGIDWLGDETQKEELNHVQDGKNYGWPYIYEDGKANPADDPEEMTGLTSEEYAKQCESPVLLYTAHAAPMGLVFYRGDAFPEEYRNDAFVAMHGSWNRRTPSGYSVARVVFDDQGRPERFEDFITGFLTEDQESQFGRPCGLAVANDGSLLMSDDSGGVIYRISYTADQR